MFNHKIKIISQTFFILFTIASVSSLIGQNSKDIHFASGKIPENRLLTNDELIAQSDTSSSTIAGIISEYRSGKKRKAIQSLANYFKERFSERYFFNWKNFTKRFKEYQKFFPARKNEHFNRAQAHILTFPAKTKWKRPFKSKSGKEISAYAFRHLARQHKAIDIAFCYYYDNEDTSYLNYFNRQIKSFNAAVESENYEKGGNAVFESFRAGYRVLNWIFVHNLFLASKKYGDADQIVMLKTLLLHGERLYRATKKFRFGNHHTKGLTALAVLSIMLKDFPRSKIWFDSAIKNLTLHLEREINADGFQFERSVHYHIGDIDNYFYVFYLAKINGIELPDLFVTKFRAMFDVLVKIAFPNGRLPVLQDDTDEPWAEYNSMKSVMTLGAVLFEDPIYRYFAANRVSDDKYWFIKKSDASKLGRVNKRKPECGCLAIEPTGYYVMRNGWENDDLYMIISNGLSKQKPDHQHADMTGIQAYANGQIILPNYQVRYFLPDYKYFKNSFVKNVALVDSVSQAQKWKGNEGGSGFGKWLDLTHPTENLFYDYKRFSVYVGAHDGFEKFDVKYERKVIFIKDGFWIVIDNFESDSPHHYQQVWQGHYNSFYDGKAVRSTFANGSGLDIIQLTDAEYSLDSSTFRGKGNFVFSSSESKSFKFVTLLYPFRHFDYRFVDLNTPVAGWNISNDSLRNGGESIFFGITEYKSHGVNISFDKPSDVIIIANDKTIEVFPVSSRTIRLEYFRKGNKSGYINLIPMKFFEIKISAF